MKNAIPGFGWILPICSLLFATSAHGAAGNDAQWQGGRGNWSNSGNWLCSGLDYPKGPAPCVPNGSRFTSIDLGSGIVNVDIAVNLPDTAIGNSAASLSLNGTSLSVAAPGISIGSVSLTNGAAINVPRAFGFPGLLTTPNLTMLNSTTNTLVTVSGPGIATGIANIDGSHISRLLLVGSGAILNSTLGDDSSLVSSSGGILVSNTSFNGSVSFLANGSTSSITIDNGSKINNLVSGIPQDVLVGSSTPGNVPLLTIKGNSQLVTGANVIVGGASSGILNLSGDGSAVNAFNEVISGRPNNNIFQPSGGIVNQTGGTNTVTSQLVVGDRNGPGEYSLRDTAVLEAGTVILGNASSGYTFTQTGGRNSVAGNLSSAEGSNGAYNLSGDNALLHVGGDENLGVENRSKMDFVQRGGRNEVTGNLNLGGTPSTIFTEPAGRGFYVLDSGSLSVGGTEVIAPKGQFMQTGGTNTANRLVVQGSYTLEGPAGTAATGSIAIATDEVIATLPYRRPAGFDQVGGSNRVGGTLTVDAHSTYTLDDGTLTATQIILACSGLFCSLEPREGGVFRYRGGNLTGNFTVESGAYFLISGHGTRVVDGNLTGSGTVEVTAQQVDFSNVIFPTGVFKVDPSKVQMHNLDVGAPAYITGAAGDVFVITGDFRNFSTQTTLWNTGAALLDFTGGGSHIFDLAGRNGAGFSHNFAWGSLVIGAGNIVDLGMGSGNALYVGSLQGLQISGSTIKNLDGAPGLIVYYDSASNPLLHGNYNLTGGGELIAASGGTVSAPEPSTLLLLAGGLGSLFAYRRQRGMLQGRTAPRWWSRPRGPRNVRHWVAGVTAPQVDIHHWHGG